MVAKSVSTPRKVSICECWARDGLQGEDGFIPTERKVEVINRLAAVGFRRIEATSFAHPRLVRQFSDALEVLERIDRPEGVTYIAVVPNSKGLDRLLESCDRGYGVHEITAILAASEAYLQASLERSLGEIMPPLADLIKRARRAGLSVIGCIGTAFGCPLTGDVPLQKLIDLTDWYLDQGASSIMLGDTTGEANPAGVAEVFGLMRQRYPRVDFIAHFHDTRGMGLANTLAALQQGVVLHDCSLGGLGGQPATRRPKYHDGYAGNTATEDLVVMMSEMGLETGLDPAEVIKTALLGEDVCGRPLLGHVTRSGPVQHRGRKALNPADLSAGQEIPPSLFFVDGDRTDRRSLPEAIVRQALENNWSRTDALSLDLSRLRVGERIPDRGPLITRLTVVESDPSRDRMALEIRSLRSDGNACLTGRILITFG